MLDQSCARDKTLEPGSFQSVSQLTESIKYTLNSDFGDVWVTGEVSGLTEPRSGHIYFTLKDSSAQISAIIWRSSVARLKLRPQEGMQVLCRGYIDVYPQRGNYQLITRVIQPIGEGTLQIAFRKLHDRLRGEGLFDDQHKRPIPRLPRRVVLVTSPTGAAIHDFLQVVSRRWPLLDIVVVPVAVQGPGAAEQIANAIRIFGEDEQKWSPDVIVVTRGGGSIEDLWSFNEEVVVRSIFASRVPVISAVGHEIDVSLSDLVADVRALTPSEAGEILVPNQMEFLDALRNLELRMAGSIRNQFVNAQSRLASLSNRPAIRKPLEKLRSFGLQLDSMESRLIENSKRQIEVTRHRLAAFLDRLRLSMKATIPNCQNRLLTVFQSPALKQPLSDIENRRRLLQMLQQRMTLAVEHLIDRQKKRTDITASKLRAFNPRRVLERGYSLTLDEQGIPVSSCKTIGTGDTIQTWLGDGKLSSVVQKIETDSRYQDYGKEEKDQVD